MIKTQIGDIIIVNPKYNGQKKNIGIDTLSRNLVYSCKKGNSCFNITLDSAKKIERDKRLSVIEIEHAITKAHTLQLVIDSPHNSNGSFHLNLTDDSNAIIQRCPICSKWFKDLNHLNFDVKNSNTNIIELSDIWDIFKNKLWLFFKKYKPIRYDITCN